MKIEKATINQEKPQQAKATLHSAVTATAKALWLLNTSTTSKLQYWWQWQTAQGMLTAMVTSKIQENSEAAIKWHQQLALATAQWVQWVVATCDSKILSIQFCDGAILCRDCQQTGLPGYSIFNAGSHWTACWAWLPIRADLQVIFFMHGDGQTVVLLGKRRYVRSMAVPGLYQVRHQVHLSREV